MAVTQRKISDSREAEILITISQQLDQMIHLLAALTTTTTTTTV